MQALNSHEYSVLAADLLTSMVDLHSHRTQLVLTALAASATTAGLLTAYSTWNRQRRRHDLNADVLRSIDSHAPGPAPSSSPSGSDPGRAYLDAKHAADGVERSTGATTPVPLDGFSYSEELVREQLARNYAFFGEDGMAKVRGGSVVVVGCGGVGSWTAVMLARSLSTVHVPMEHILTRAFAEVSPKSDWWILTTSPCRPSTDMRRPP